MVKKYQLLDREVHMIGDYVGVCWNTRKEKKQIKGEDGLTYEASVPVRRQSNSYIDFVWVREHGEEPYEDEDSPVSGGFGKEQALVIAGELLQAVRYMDRLT